MNDLDPTLKRLFRWARAASPRESETVPFGFASRLLALRKPVQALTLLEALQQTPWTIAGVSLAVIVCGSLFLASQLMASSSTAEISSVMNFMTSKLTQQ